MENTVLDEKIPVNKINGRKRSNISNDRNEVYSDHKKLKILGKTEVFTIHPAQQKGPRDQVVRLFTTVVAQISAESSVFFFFLHNQHIFMHHIPKNFRIILIFFRHPIFVIYIHVIETITKYYDFQHWH